MHRALIQPRSAAPPTPVGVREPALAMLSEVLAGLSGRRPSLPSKLFYDEAGSRLFERITTLPQYYQTRTELAILQSAMPDLARRLGGDIMLIEYGSGSSTKTRLLIEALDVRRYIPIDISRWYLEGAAADLRATFPKLLVEPIVADYTQAVRLPNSAGGAAGRVGFFPGSTIGNFTPEDAEVFLSGVASTLGRGGRLIIGFDLKKDPERLHAAYNDSAGVTAAFNLNLLRRLNRELGADFDLCRWHHYAFYSPVPGRIEMHLVSATRQTVSIAGHFFDFEKGRSIHTENSYKYTRRGIKGLARRGGFAIEEIWTDPGRLFAVALLRVRPGAARSD